MRNTSEAVTIGLSSNIILDLNNNTLSNKGDKAVIDNSGTLSIINGNINTSAETGAIDNRSGSLTISNVNITATGTKQAVYIYAGTVEITGNSYLSSNTTGAYNNMDRGTVQNINGTLKVTGGTIVGNNQHAISNAGTLIIGEKDGNISTSSPALIGKTNGVNSSVAFSFYDGIIKGQSAAIIGTVSDQENNTHIKAGTETISGSTYQTAILEED